MSFYWSGDEEEEDDFEEWTRKQEAKEKESNGNQDESDPETLSQGQEKQFQPVIQATASLFNDFEDDEEEEDIGWEDTPEMDVKGPEQPILINLQKPAEEKKERERDTKKKTAKRKRVYRLESLHPQEQHLVWDLHRSHLLALSSRAVRLSAAVKKLDDDVLAVILSLIPNNLAVPGPPTLSQLKDLVLWYGEWVRGAPERRRERVRANRRAGAPMYGPRTRRTAKARRTTDEPPLSSDDLQRMMALLSVEVPLSFRLVRYIASLSASDHADPQLQAASYESIDDPVLFSSLLMAMTRALGWRTRWVQGMDCIPLDLTVDHPIVDTLGQSKRRKRKRPRTSNTSSIGHEVNEETKPTNTSQKGFMDWMEVFCSVAQERKARTSNDMKKRTRRWVHVDAANHLFNQPQQVETLWKIHTISDDESNRKHAGLPYVLAVEHHPTLRLTDVTPRYANSWVEALRSRGVIRGKKKVAQSWWSDTLKKINRPHEQGATSNSAIYLPDSDDDSNSNDHVDEQEDKKPAARPTDDHEAQEQNELEAMSKQEAIPTSKVGFRKSPVYVIPSVLGKAEVIEPNAKLCGLFKGERVYLRTAVSTALSARKWPYQGRRVKKGQEPIRKVKARAKPNQDGTNFRALKSYGASLQEQQTPTATTAAASPPFDDDTNETAGVEELFAIWQTEKWSPPPVGPTDPIPVNEYNNVELALLPPGLVHIPIRGAAKVAKRLGIPYAPCLLGFEGRGGGGKHCMPTIRGIVVHEHNEEVLTAAVGQVQQFQAVSQEEKRRKTVLLRWKKLLVGLLTQDRLEREYGGDEEASPS